jgi:hypothetical protein
MNHRNVHSCGCNEEYSLLGWLQARQDFCDASRAQYLAHVYAFKIAGPTKAFMVRTRTSKVAQEAIVLLNFHFQGNLQMLRFPAHHSSFVSAMFHVDGEQFGLPE